MNWYPSEKARQMDYRQNKAFKGLTARTINCLKAEEYQSKKEVRDAVLSGEIHPMPKGKNHIPNYGRKSHAEVLSWLGLENSPIYVRSNTLTVDRYKKYLEKNGYLVTKNNQQ